jgi:hypothetical protein
MLTCVKHTSLLQPSAAYVKKIVCLLILNTFQLLLLYLLMQDLKEKWLLISNALAFYI